MHILNMYRVKLLHSLKLRYMYLFNVIIQLSSISQQTVL